MINDQWSMINDKWSMINDQSSIMGVYASPILNKIVQIQSMCPTFFSGIDIVLLKAKKPWYMPR